MSFWTLHTAFHLHNTQRENTSDFDFLRFFQLDLEEYGDRGDSHGNIEQQVDDVCAQVSRKSISTFSSWYCLIPGKFQRYAV
jgi:hypothetical protein